MTDRIRPGDIVPITFAGESIFSVKVLGLLGQRRVISHVKRLQSTQDSEERFDMLIQILRELAATEITEDWLDTITMADANEIMAKAIQLGQVSEEERKKSESLPS